MKHPDPSCPKCHGSGQVTVKHPMMGSQKMACPACSEDKEDAKDHKGHKGEHEEM